MNFRSVVLHVLLSAKWKQSILGIRPLRRHPATRRRFPIPGRLWLLLPRYVGRADRVQSRAALPADTLLGNRESVPVVLAWEDSPAANRSVSPPCAVDYWQRQSSAAC